MYVCINIHIYIYMYIYVCVCVCAYVPVLTDTWSSTPMCVWSSTPAPLNPPLLSSTHLLCVEGAHACFEMFVCVVWVSLA